MATKGATKRTTRTSSTAVTPPPEIEHTPANCRAREMIVRVADKWSMYVIHVLASAGPLRFNEIRRRVDGVSQRMLTVTLRGLERDGLVTRTVFPTIPPRVDYELTRLGHSLLEPVSSLSLWARQNRSAIETARRQFDAAEHHR